MTCHILDFHCTHEEGRGISSVLRVSELGQLNEANNLANAYVCTSLVFLTSVVNSAIPKVYSSEGKK
jgi:hypothetical protein